MVVGFLALAGLDAEMGIVMLIYLTHAYNDRGAEGKMNTKADLYEAVIEGTGQRIRPKVMTVTAIIAGLLPLMWSTGTGLT